MSYQRLTGTSDHFLDLVENESIIEVDVILYSVLVLRTQFVGRNHNHPNRVISELFPDGWVTDF